MIRVKKNKSSIFLIKASKLTLAVLAVTIISLTIMILLIGDDDVGKFFKAHYVLMYFPVTLFYLYSMMAVSVFVYLVYIVKRYCVPADETSQKIVFILIFSFIGAPFIGASLRLDED